jgi:hypothetical protein
MSTSTVRNIAPALPDVTSSGHRSSQRHSDVFLFERTKLRTVPSTWWTLAAVLGATVALGAVIAGATMARWDHSSAAQHAGFNPTMRSLAGLLFGQLAVGVLGSLVATSEYATGTARSTFAAVPRRRAVLLAKAEAIALPVLIVGTVASLAAFLTGQAIFSSKGVGVSLGAPGELRAVIGGGLYLTVLALFALGLGATLRHTAGAISTFVGFVLVLPLLVSPLPDPWGRDIVKYLPSDAGQAIWSVHTTSSMLSPWVGFGVLCAWAAAALFAAAWLVTRRDV